MKTPQKNSVRFIKDRNEAYYNNREVRLSPKEYKVLVYLEESGKTTPRELLLSDIWGAAEIESRTIDQHVARLRRKFWPGVILTVAGCGYKYHHA